MRHVLLLVGLSCACGARSASDSIYDEPPSAGGTRDESGGASFAGSGSANGGSSSGGLGAGGAANGGAANGGAANGGSGSGGRASGGITSRGGAGSGGNGFGGSGFGGTGLGGAGSGGASSGGRGSGGKGSGGNTTMEDIAACSSMCSSIYSVCPVPNSDSVRCSAGCVSDLSELGNRCRELQRRAIHCIDGALSGPAASCTTLAIAITVGCRRELERSGTCR